MNRTSKSSGIIIAVILVCIYGVIGIPKSKDELVANWKKNIHLGLDLSGGTQLVMQVQLQDAFKAVADSVMDACGKSLKRTTSLRPATSPATTRIRLRTPTRSRSTLRAFRVDKTSQFRSTSDDQFAEWDLTAVNSTDYKLTMKPTESLKMKQDTLTQTMATIERKINALGLAESSVQPTGRSDAEAELLIQLPGVDDPGHVKQILQTQAVLEWDEVKDGPFTLARRSALQARRNSALEHQAGADRRARRPASWYLVSRIPVVRGTDIRDASAAPGEVEPLGNEFRPDPGRRQEVRAFIRKRISASARPSSWMAW